MDIIVNNNELRKRMNVASREEKQILKNMEYSQFLEYIIENGNKYKMGKFTTNYNLHEIACAYYINGNVMTKELRGHITKVYLLSKYSFTK